MECQTALMPCAPETAETVTSPALAAFLLNPGSEPLISAFLGRESTVSDAAAQTGASLNTTFKRVQRLLALGFLSAGQDTRRAGRRVPTYRSRADSYFIPYDLAPHDTLEAQQEQLEWVGAAQFARSVARARLRATHSYGRHMQRRSDGVVDYHPALGPGELLPPDHPDLGPLFTLCEPEIWLSADDARALERELRELYSRYGQRHGPRPYLLKLGIVEKV